jgi:hypothetical protein
MICKGTPSVAFPEAEINAASGNATEGVPYSAEIAS